MWPALSLDRTSDLRAGKSDQSGFRRAPQGLAKCKRLCGAVVRQDGSLVAEAGSEKLVGFGAERGVHSERKRRKPETSLPDHYSFTCVLGAKTVPKGQLNQSLLTDRVAFIRHCGSNEKMKQVLERFKALVGYRPGILRMPLEFFKILVTIMIINIVAFVVISLAYEAFELLYTLFGKT